jgi:hypothetical protein
VSSRASSAAPPPAWSNALVPPPRRCDGHIHAIFDAAYLVAVLVEIGDQDAALREPALILRPGGELPINAEIWLYINAPGRIRTCDLRIRSGGLGGGSGSVEPNPGCLRAAGSGSICRVGDTVRDTVS